VDERRLEVYVAMLADPSSLGDCGHDGAGRYGSMPGIPFSFCRAHSDWAGKAVPALRPTASDYQFDEDVSQSSQRAYSFPWTNLGRGRDENLRDRLTRPPNLW